MQIDLSAFCFFKQALNINNNIRVFEKTGKEKHFLVRVYVESVTSTFFLHRELVKSSSIPWVAVTVWGFTDCPVTWKKNEHGHFLSGENFYTFVVFPGGNYWLYKAMGDHDICS